MVHPIGEEAETEINKEVQSSEGGLGVGEAVTEAGIKIEEADQGIGVNLMIVVEEK
jgi:hypothetical protein